MPAGKGGVEVERLLSAQQHKWPSHAPVTASLRTRKKAPSEDANRARLYMKKRANTGLLDAIS